MTDNVAAAALDPNGDSVRDFGLNDIPPLAPIVAELIAAVSDPDIALDEIADMVALDPALSIRVMRLSKSPMFLCARPPETIADAVRRLGMKQIRDMVTTLALHDALPGAGSTTARQSWSDTITIAAIANELAAKRRGDLGDGLALCYIAALCQHVGSMMMLHVIGGDYESYVACTAESCECERQAFGVDHGDLGARLLATWEMPASVVASARFHVGEVGAEDPVVRLVQSANVLHRLFLESRQADEEPDPDQMFDGVDIHGLSGAAMLALLVNAVETAEALVGMLTD